MQDLVYQHFLLRWMKTSAKRIDKVNAFSLVLGDLLEYSLLHDR